MFGSNSYNQTDFQKYFLKNLFQFFPVKVKLHHKYKLNHKKLGKQHSLILFIICINIVSTEYNIKKFNFNFPWPLPEKTTSDTVHRRNMTYRIY